MKGIIKTDEYEEFILDNDVNIRVYHHPNRTIEMVSENLDIPEHIEAIDDMLKFYKKEYKKIHKDLIVRSRDLELDQYCLSIKRISTFIEFLE